MRRGYVGVLVGLSAVAFVGGCYDSRWGEAKRAQTRNAAHVAPAELESAPARSDAPPLKVRFYRTPEYAAQTVDADRQVREMVEAANGTMAGLGVRLEVESVRAWDARVGGAQDLPAWLTALGQADAGSETDWVVGLVGSLPRASASFHELGMAPVRGKHMVIRAAARADESDAIERAFDELSAEERDRLRRSLRRHRATTIFLHELGHTLGAIHEVDAQSIMSARYSKDARGFGDDTVTLLRVSLRLRLDPKADARAAHGDAAAFLKAHPGSFVEDERVAEIARLERAATALEAAPPSAPSAPPATKPADTGIHVAEDAPGLPDAHREVYRRARAELLAGRAREAREVAKSLFSTYPKSLEVQELRCQTALGMRLAWADVNRECAAVVELTGAPR